MRAGLPSPPERLRAWASLVASAMVALYVGMGWLSETSALPGALERERARSVREDSLLWAVVRQLQAENLVRDNDLLVTRRGVCLLLHRAGPGLGELAGCGAISARVAPDGTTTLPRPPVVALAGAEHPRAPLPPPVVHPPWDDRQRRRFTWSPWSVADEL